MISQHCYLESILQKEGMDQANPIGMLLEHNAKFEPNLDGNIESHSNLYAWLMGKLQFIANAKVEVMKIQHGLYKHLDMVSPICYSSTTPQ